MLMRSLFTGLFGLVLSTCVARADIVFCDSSQSFSFAQLPVTEILPGVPGKQIGFCGLTLFTSNNPGTIQFFIGFAPNCSVMQNPITALITLPSNQSYVHHLASAFSSTMSGEAICVSSTGNGTITGSIYYLYY